MLGCERQGRSNRRIAEDRRIEAITVNLRVSALRASSASRAGPKRRSRSGRARARLRAPRAEKFGTVPSRAATGPGPRARRDVASSYGKATLDARTATVLAVCDKCDQKYAANFDPAH